MFLRSLFKPTLLLITISLYSCGATGTQKAKHIESENLDRIVCDVNGKPVFTYAIYRFRESISNQPNVAENWVKLGGAYYAGECYKAASESFKNANVLTNYTNPDYLAYLADSIAMENSRVLAGQPEVLLKQALAIDPSHVKTLLMLGASEYEKHNYREAIKHWEHLLTVLPSDEVRVKEQIEQNISEANCQRADSASAINECRVAVDQGNAEAQ
ncbi:MAG: hypothetical protein HY273_09690 [Gammaproteobacteria bacterium]|nr:hypothetical protein [Gammaproteobacteria bacterium]